MENLNLILLSGGCYHCTPEWNEEPYGRENCYKLYFPVEGSASICTNGEWHELTAGNVYFINGFMLDQYRCDNFMKVYWLHFIPESQFLSMHLNNLEPLYCWKPEHFPLPDPGYEKIPLLFDNPYIRNNKPLEMTSFSLTCYVNSMILLFISDLNEKSNMNIGKASYDLYFKLEPALELMKNHYQNNLRLNEIAQKAYLNPIYFLRLFKKCFKISPNRYLNMIRLQEACRLLMKSDLSIKEIAAGTGFNNQFYFSKVFKSHFHKTPLEYRNTKLSP